MTNIERIADFRDVRVFSQATVLPIIVVASRSNTPDKKNQIVVEVYNNKTDKDKLLTSVDIWEQFPELIFNLSMSKVDIRICKKIENNSEPISKSCDVKFGVKVYQRGKGKPPQTGEEAKNKIFESKTRETNRYYPYIRGKYVTSWHMKKTEAWLKYGQHLAEPREFELFTGPRVLVRRIVGKKLIMVPTKDTVIADQLLHTVKPIKTPLDFRYIAAIIGSKLITYYFRKRFNRTEKTFPEIRVAELRQLPIHEINFFEDRSKEKHKEIIVLVDRILGLNQKLAKEKIPITKNQLERQIKATDNQIDQLVYELYGLTEKEIKIVEEALK
jgi:hypothetical protein